MKYLLFYIIPIGLLVSQTTLKAQAQADNFSGNSYPVYVEGKDTVVILNVKDVIVYPPLVFPDEKAELQYKKLIRDVKKTLPYAKMIYATLIETYEYIETIPDDKAREKHLKRMENDLYEEYKPVLKKMTLSQGKLLIKLIDRECNQSSYELVKAFLGSFRAGFWNFFAGMFGASLKSKWDPKGKDAETERIIVLVENGIL